VEPKLVLSNHKTTEKQRKRLSNRQIQSDSIHLNRKKTGR